MHRKAEHTCPRHATDPKQPPTSKPTKKEKNNHFLLEYFVVISTPLTLLISSIYPDVEFNCNLEGT